MKKKKLFNLSDEAQARLLKAAQGINAGAVADAARKRWYTGTNSNWEPAEDAGNLTFEKLQQAKEELECFAPAEDLIEAMLICERLPIGRPLLVTDPADDKRYYILSRKSFDELLQQIPEDTAVEPGDPMFNFYSPTPETRRIIPLGVAVIENADEVARGLISRLAAAQAAARYGHNIRFD